MAMADVLKLVIEKYKLYQQELLNLSNLADIDELKKHSPNLNRNLWCEVIAKCIRDNCSDLRALTLDGNRIVELHNLVQSLGDGLQLDSLSLRNNKISDIHDIQRLRNLRLKHLILMGNPIYKADSSRLKRALTKALPSLERIDAAKIDKTSMLDRWPPKTAGFSEAIEFHHAILACVQRYYQAAAGMPDTVEALMGMYSPSSMVTLTMERHFSLGMSHDGQQYVRNLLLEGHGILSAPVKETHHGVHQGRLSIGNFLKKFHAVKLEFDPTDIMKKTDIVQHNPNVFQQSGHPCPTLMTVAMHGAVTFRVKESRKSEDEKAVKRYYDRTWVITALNGAPTILQDIIHLRDPHREREALFVPPPGQAAGRLYYGLHMRLDDMKVIELAAATGLSPTMARNCLEADDSGPWDLDRAAVFFQQMKAQSKLQPDHFANCADKAVLACHVFMEHSGLTLEAAQMCLTLPEVQGDMWKGWQLFLECQRTDKLRPEHYVRPPGAG